MRICILNIDYKNYSTYHDWTIPIPNPTPYLKNYTFENYFIRKKNIKAQIAELLAKDFDLYFNLCDGAENEDIPGIEIVQLLEKAKVAFTGASSSFYEPSRLQMKEACRKVKVEYPPGILFNKNDSIQLITRTLKFPLIVKHPNSFNSIGLTRDSVVNNSKELQFQISKMIKKFNGAFVEEYITGREFTVLLAENPDDSTKPVIFLPMEIIFPDGETFKHFDLKWKAHNTMKYVHCSNNELSENISKASSAMFNAMNGTGYARCDIRMDKSGNLFMLEINPNCSIYFPSTDPASSDEILFAEPDGHQRFTDLIIKSALKCRNLKVSERPVSV